MEALEQVKKTVVEKAKGALSEARDALRDARDAIGEIVSRVVAKVRGGAGGGDVLAVLKEDAEVLRAYLDELEAPGRPAAVREGLLAQLSYELEQNAELREKGLYPLLADKAELREAVQDALRAHELMRQHLGGLLGAPAGKEFRAELVVLKENVLRRLADDEAQLFPAVQKLVPAADLRALGERIRKERQAAGAAAEAERADEAEAAAAAGEKAADEAADEAGAADKTAGKDAAGSPAA